MAWEANKVLSIGWILLRHFFDLVALTLLNLDCGLSIGLCVGVSQSGNVFLGVRIYLVSWLGEIELLVLWMVWIVMVSVAERQRYGDEFE